MIQIRDDGSGMPAEVPEGLGLRIMRNRALILGGKLNIENANPHGTVVTCTIIREH
jgi:signal transduction histidine kinase